MIEENGEEIKILRDNMPFGSAGRASSAPTSSATPARRAPIEQMLENMFVGRPPGNYDRLLDFSRAVTGKLFFVPSATFLEASAADDPAAAPPPPARGADAHRPTRRRATVRLGIGSLKGERRT